jgi:7,8-dihydro-6-hydroxymethylpterin-pyrophosphokinase
VTQALVSIGSNIERDFHIEAAVHALRQLDPQCRFSRVFEAEPVGFEGPNFYNLIAELHTAQPLETFGRPSATLSGSMAASVMILSIAIAPWTSTYSPLVITANPVAPPYPATISINLLLPFGRLLSCVRRKPCPVMAVPSLNFGKHLTSTNHYGPLIPLPI